MFIVSATFPPRAVREPPTSAVNKQQLLAWIREGELQRALTMLEAARQRFPDDDQLVNMHAGVLAQMGQLDQAIALLTALLAQHPNHEIARNNLLPLLLQSGQAAKALAMLKTFTPPHPQAINLAHHLLMLCQQHADLATALESCQYLMALGERSSGLLTTYGQLLNQLGGNAETVVALMREALVIDPDSAISYNNLAVALHEAGEHRQACAVLATAVERFPCHLRFRTTELLFALSGLLWQGLEAKLNAALAQIDLCHRLIESGLEHDLIKALTDQSSNSLPGETRQGLMEVFCFLFFPQVSAAAQRRINRVLSATWSAQFNDPVVPADAYSERQERGRNRRLRIAYLSADFRQHATMFLCGQVITSHRQERYDVFAYALGPDDTSDLGDGFRRSIEHYRNVDHLSDRQIAEIIARDEIDILVDLKGFTRFSRPAIFAYRPAPLQVNWLGFPGTLGDRRLADYLIGDPITTPESAAPYYAEQIAQMPHCYQPNDLLRPRLAPLTRRDCGLPDDAFVCCSFNNAFKLNPPWLSVWARLLQRLPKAVLWLLEVSVHGSQTLLDYLAEHGIAAERIIIAARVMPEQHFARIGCADVALDTFPCSSHTTASDALWAGVPLVTRIGETFASRVAASVLHAAKLPELICTSDEDYIDCVVRLHDNREWLSSLRQRLSNLEQLPLFDTVQFTRDLEQLYETMWRQWQQHIDAPILAYKSNSIPS